MPTFSIIISSYNGAKYIDQCFKSLLAQSYNDYEVVFIDDGSTDETLSILETKYVNLCDLKIIRHNNNLGVSCSRNDGISKSNGQWLFFLDVDDYISEDCLSSALRFIDESSFDFAFFPYAETTVDGKVKPRTMQIDDGVYSKEEALKFLLVDIDYSVFCCVGSKIYRKSFLIENNIKFDDSIYKYNEDGAFAICALNSSKSVGFFNYQYYFYVKYGSGTTMTSYRPYLFCTLINVDSILFNLINSQSIVAVKQKEAFYSKTYVTMFSSLKNESDFSTYSSFKAAFKLVRKSIFFKDTVKINKGFKKRFLLFLLKINFSLLTFITFKIFSK